MQTVDMKSQLNVKIDETIHDDLKIYAIRTKRKINEITQDAIVAYLKNDGSTSDQAAELRILMNEQRP